MLCCGCCVVALCCVVLRVVLWVLCCVVLRVVFRCFQKPADPQLHLAMVETAEDLLDQFSPTLAYTQSDEITLVFPASTILPPANVLFLSYLILFHLFYYFNYLFYFILNSWFYFDLFYLFVYIQLFSILLILFLLFIYLLVSYFISLHLEDKELIFGGGVQKITSIMASFAGVRFNFHINQKDYPPGSPQRKKAEEFSAHFDARAFNGLSFFYFIFYFVY